MTDLLERLKQFQGLDTSSPSSSTRESRKRKRTTVVQWKDAELELLYKLLLPRYMEFNERNRGNRSKTGPTPKQKLLQYLCNELQKAGSSKTTTNIDDKIRNDVTRYKKRLIAELNGGCGIGFVTPICPSYMEDFDSILREECKAQASRVSNSTTEVCDKELSDGDENFEMTLDSIAQYAEAKVKQEAEAEAQAEADLTHFLPGPSSIDAYDELLEKQTNLETASETLLMLQHKNEQKKLDLLKLQEEVMREKMNAQKAKAAYYEMMRRIEMAKNPTVFNE